MRLYLDRRILLDQRANSLANVVTDAHRGSKGWVAHLVAGRRHWVSHTDAILSRAGFGQRIFALAEPGTYEADSACVSLKAHRIRFDVFAGGVIRLRRSTDPRRCGHLRLLDPLPPPDSGQQGAAPLTLVASMTSRDSPWQAALLLGGLLESHLRQMCEDRGLGTGDSEWSKGIDGLSAALKKVGFCSSKQHKEIIALAQLRKRAQHRGQSPSAVEIQTAIEKLHALMWQVLVSSPMTLSEALSPEVYMGS